MEVVSVMYVRLKFRKEGPIRFIGHLDLMRTFQKLFVRANIPVAYSEGYNPHQIFSFAAALAVGVSSQGEYMDLRLAEEMSLSSLIDQMNTYAPMGIHIEAGIIICKKEPKAMAALRAADYTITLLEPTITAHTLKQLMAMEEVLIKKKTKKGKMNDFDLRPGILHLSLNASLLEMRLATGSQLNIRPEMVLEVLMRLEKKPYKRGNFVFHRKELFQELEGLQPLLVSKLGSDCNE